MRAGAHQVQGTLNGLGERCGNADLIALIPTLMLKMGYATGVAAGLRRLTEVSRAVNERLNVIPTSSAYVGARAFTQKAGLHVLGGMREGQQLRAHVPPELVGNQRHVVVSRSSRARHLSLRVSFQLEIASARAEWQIILQLVRTCERIAAITSREPRRASSCWRGGVALAPEFFRSAAAIYRRASPATLAMSWSPRSRRLSRSKWAPPDG